VQNPFLECCGRFSPDGKWVAYNSWETGIGEIYVQPFPGTGGRVRVSTSGGLNVSWRSDGNALFYEGDFYRGRTMQVPVSGAGATRRFGQPQPLFDALAIVSPDGRTFLGAAPRQPRSPITVLLNWKDR